MCAHSASAEGSAGHFPVTEVQWRAVLEDAGFLDKIKNLRTAMTAPAEPGYESKIHSLVEALETLCNQCLWFCPPVRLSDEYTAVGTFAARVNEFGAFLKNGQRTGGLWPILSELEAQSSALAGLTTLTVDADDRSGLLLETFGIDVDKLDHPIDVADALVTEVGVTEVNAKAASLYRHLLPPQPAYVPDPRHSLLSIAHVPRPLVAHRTAVMTRDLLLSQLPQHAALLSTACAPLAKRANYNRFANFGILQGLRALTSLSTDPETVLYLSAYGFLDLVEVPLRLIGRALLNTMGKAPPRPDTLGPLYNALASADHELTSDLAKLIHVPWRNAIAHRDLYWDAEREGIIVKNDLVELAQFAVEYRRGYSFHQGFEVGVSMARAGSIEFRESLVAAVGSLPVALVDNRIRDAFSSSGANIRGTERSVNAMALIIDKMDILGLQKVCAGLADAIKIDDSIREWVISAPDCEPLVLSTEAIEAMIESCSSADSKPFLLFPYALTPVFASASRDILSDETTSLIAVHFTLNNALGEYERWGPFVRLRSMEAFGQLSRSLRCQRRALRAAEEVSGVNSEFSNAVVRNMEALERGLEELDDNMHGALARFIASADELRLMREVLPPLPGNLWPWDLPS